MKLFYLFERQGSAHLRKSRQYLEDANLGRVEHLAAAEHHSALAKMYAERIARIEAEIGDAFEMHSISAESVQQTVPEEARLKSDSVLLYPSRASHG